MVSEITVWVNEWIINPNGLRVTPYKDYGERSVIFAHLNTRPAPRVPRQTEPAPLWWVLAMVVFVGTFLGLLLGCGAHAAVASVELVVGWLSGVLP